MTENYKDLKQSLFYYLGWKNSHHKREGKSLFKQGKQRLQENYEWSVNCKKSTQKYEIAQEKKQPYKSHTGPKSGDCVCAKHTFPGNLTFISQKVG